MCREGFAISDGVRCPCERDYAWGVWHGQSAGNNGQGDRLFQRSCSVPFGGTRQGGAWAVWVTCLLPKQVCSSGGWDQLASSAGPPSGNVKKSWWAGAAKRRWSHPAHAGGNAAMIARPSWGLGGPDCTPLRRLRIVVSGVETALRQQAGVERHADMTPFWLRGPSVRARRMLRR